MLDNSYGALTFFHGRRDFLVGKFFHELHDEHILIARFQFLQAKFYRPKIRLIVEFSTSDVS